MDVNEMAQAAYENSKDHGWYDDKRTPLEIHMLIVSEVAEATEEVRNGKPSLYFKCKTAGDADYTESQLESLVQSGHNAEDIKPEGEAIELADVVIRVMDYFGAKGWDLEKAILYKHQYNKTRPFKHGNKLL
jgi:NTP pyrophosphatase (non-canonical NTP hydrolase)